ncbi:MalY/PatB family protein [Profundibacterium mesophilum]|uniref:cysteine-S-conjugate beta-lyase n=1 Tax=Profundibacterium mesophilum KAUST100406-0324 TaxID=1037889 RepID=A0A921NU04_9RHOB|nr:MalY/PatB family protein [Profundibacterium mesophilum]KAF0675528.1 putative aminotransferase [Profundibacterium mesophilum KAUST100406-0324]
MDFDEIIDRRGTHCSKWDMMEPLYGVSPQDGIAMWVADMDFRPPRVVTEALEAMTAHGIYGYYGDEGSYLEAIRWWLGTRHGWTPEARDIFSANGLVNGTAMCVDTYTAPGDGVVLFSPVYHAFYRVITAAGRRVVECPLALENGRHVFDFDAYDAQMDGSETMLILCSPHNPGGRVWSTEELRAVAAFAERHGLVLVSDEIHQDIVMPGHQHMPMPLAAPEAAGRTIVLNAATKSFNIAGAHIGNVIISDPELRRAFAARMTALGQSPNSFGLHMVTAAYSPQGAEWIDALNTYLDGNRRTFEEAMAAIPGVAPVPIEATYLCWIDMRGTGMDQAELAARIGERARIAASAGPSFGTGGEGFARFNIAMPRARVEEAAARLTEAFSDLQ